MGCKELIESLRAGGNEKLQALRTEAEREAELIRASTAAQIAELRADYRRQRTIATTRHTEATLAEASRAGRRIRIAGERALAARLYGLAQASLPTLRQEAYPEVFAALVRELPAGDWQLIRVNPQDAALAKEHFPAAEVLTEESIAGGLEAATPGDQLRVVNTFEKRLERLWEEILPDMMKEIRELAL
jgi:vacuolar-type H+-ATPase subunit E/Vma4